MFESCQLIIACVISLTRRARIASLRNSDRLRPLILAELFRPSYSSCVSLIRRNGIKNVGQLFVLSLYHYGTGVVGRPRIRQKLWEKAMQEAKAEGLSPSELIEDALESYLDQKRAA